MRRHLSTSNEVSSDKDFSRRNRSSAISNDLQVLTTLFDIQPACGAVFDFRQFVNVNKERIDELVREEQAVNPLYQGRGKVDAIRKVQFELHKQLSSEQ